VPASGTPALALVLLLALVLDPGDNVAAASDADPGPAAHAAAHAAAAALVGAGAPGERRWWHCLAGAVPVECAWLEVPLDHGDPRSGSLELLVSRIRALDDARRVGVLVTIAGGPGQRGTDLVRPGAHTAAIQAAFDIVSWDPRGTSHGSRIDCIPTWDPFAGLDRTPDTAAEQDALDERVATLAARCREAHGDLLPFVGTIDSARDLEGLRRLLGEERISVMGSSYGSRVAVAYATLFPDRVRAVVLDGYSDPNSPPGELVLEQAEAFERALDGLLAACDADPGCPFGDGEAGHALDRLLERLDRAPIPTGAGAGRRLGESDAREAIAGSLVLGAHARHELLDALASAAAGDGGPLLRVADDVRHTYESSGLTQGVFMAVTCADTAGHWDGLSPEDVADLAARVREGAPRLGAWLWSPPAADDLPPLGLCAMLPRDPPRPPGPLDAAGAGPILVLATTGDPTTPVTAARRAAEDLEHAALLTLEADRHLAYHPAVRDPGRPAHRCVLSVVEAYLLDGVVPPAGSTCPDGASASEARVAP
jgi:pimeloyl-ACP methyl ester carboxylesterase